MFDALDAALASDVTFFLLLIALAAVSGLAHQIIVARNLRARR